MSWKMMLEELVAATNGKVRSQFAREFQGVGTDSRSQLKNKIFIALKGDAFDAHDFLNQAVASGASALVVHRLPDNAKVVLDQVTVVEVDDTLMALQKLAHFWRQKMRARILGLTGSNGKTTTKEFAAALISSCRDVQFSKGSLNNHWGVPMSLLEIEPQHEFALIEMGMNHPGELTTLSEIAQPDVICVTMVGRGHLEGLGSIAGVAQAKEEVYESAKPDSIRIFNVENDHTRVMYERYAPRLKPEQVITFAGCDYARRHSLFASSAHRSFLNQTDKQNKARPGSTLDITLEVTSMGTERMMIRGEIRGVTGEALVPVFGQQNITNLMAAAGFALAAGLLPSEIWRAFPKCHTVWGRNQWVHLSGGALVLFDGYNANPESMKAALENFSHVKAAGNGKKYAILGEMKEMGSHALSLHRELGEQAGAVDFSAIAFFGPSHDQFEKGLKGTKYSKSLFVSDSYEQKLAPRMLPVLQVDDIVLIKGSRGMHLEKALLDLKPLDFQPKK